jgi:hypothetical protein
MATLLYDTVSEYLKAIFPRDETPGEDWAKVLGEQCQCL